MEEKSLLLDHPLILSYLKEQGIKEFNEDTEFPVGLLSIVYEDYTGVKVSFRNFSQIRSDMMVSFGQFFAHDRVE